MVLIVTKCKRKKKKKRKVQTRTRELHVLIPVNDMTQPQLDSPPHVWWCNFQTPKGPYQIGRRPHGPWHPPYQLSNRKVMDDTTCIRKWAPHWGRVVGPRVPRNIDLQRGLIFAKMLRVTLQWQGHGGGWGFGPQQ